MYPKILVIEQTGNIRKLLEEIREFNDFHFISTSEISLGFQIFQNLSPHLIIVDFNLPNFNGYCFARRVNGNFKRCHIPLIAILNAEQNADLCQGLYSIDEYLWQPVNIQQLTHLIQVYLPAQIGDYIPTKSLATRC